MIDEDWLDHELRAAMTGIVARDLPPQLQAISQRHVEAVANLVATMRAAGIDDVLLRQSVRESLASYELELADAVLRFVSEEA